MKRKLIIAAAILVFLACVMALAAGLYLFGTSIISYLLPTSQVPAQQAVMPVILNTPTAQFTPRPTATMTPTPTPDLFPATGWKFKGFSGKKTYEHGWKYSWGNFTNDNGSKITAMCSAPNSPDPEFDSYFKWDKKNNILVPVVDNKNGNIQRFWYPSPVK